MAAVMARAPADWTLLAFQQNRLANRNQPDPDLRQSFLRDCFRAAQARRFGHEIAVRQLRQSFTRAEDMHLALGVTVERRDLFIVQGPVLFDAVKRALAKIVGREPQADCVPMKRAPAERANAIDADPVSAILNRLPDVVAVKRSLFEKPEAALRQIVRPVVNVQVFKATFASGLDQDSVRPGGGQFFDHKAAGGPGADDEHVVDLLSSGIHFALRFSRYFLSLTVQRKSPIRNP